MIKQLAAATLLVLPVAISALPSQASAAEVFIAPDNHRYELIAHRDFHRRWVAGYWEGHGRHRHWVGGYYVR